VAQTDNPTTRPAALSPVARVAWIALILVTLYLCYFHNLGAIGLVGPDEPRYAWIARDMHETGDWVTPRLYGKPWFEKPVLYYWGAALSFKLFGVSDASARFPSAFAALLATLALAWLALRLYGAETARWLLVILPTSVAMIGFSHAAATDMPFAAMLTIAMVFAAGILGLVPSTGWPLPSPSTSFDLNSQPRSLISLCLFGVFLGLATLAKGPAALILSGGAVLAWATITRRWRDAFRCLHPAAILCFCLTALPWYIACTRRNPDFFRVFIIEHNFKRFLTPEFQHIQPLWFYVPVLLIALFPWFIFLAPAVSRFLLDWKQHLPMASSQIYLFCWAGFTFLFFTISKSKLPGYILPGIPPLALLLANTISSNASGSKKSSRWSLVATGFALIVFGILLRGEAPKMPAMECVSPVCGISRIWIVAICGGAVVGGLAAVRQLRIGFFAVVLTVLYLVVEIDRFLPNLDPGVSARDAIQTVTNVWPEFSARDAATWQLNRSFGYQLSYYTREELPEWRPDQPKPLWLFVAKDKQQPLLDLGFRCVNFAVSPAVIPCRDVSSIRALDGRLRSRGSNDGGDRQPR
jgi:4-amino-4-deoxy-L-arabinose transferase-like glycosyltransferase